MRVVIQRVSSALVSINDSEYKSISNGLLLLLGFEKEHKESDIPWMIKKILNMRIFSNREGKMDWSVQDISGEVLVISQFTLFASTKKGNRPSFTIAEDPILAEKSYTIFLQELEKQYPNKIKSGEFGADMKVSLINDGPVTILLDSENRE